MSYFTGMKLRRLRQLKGLSLADVYEITGISRAQISRIENGKSDPRMSTVTQLLSCYEAALSDLEQDPPDTMTLAEIRERSRRASEVLARVGLGESDPWARLDRKSRLGRNVTNERRAIATRS